MARCVAGEAPMKIVDKSKE